MDEARVERHYARGGLVAAIEAGLAALGKDAEPPGLEDLAPVDEFHIGGRAASLHLLEPLALAPGTRVLDVGSGLGGTARLLADRWGCDVTGVDLTAAFCVAADRLTGRVGLSDRVRYRRASALALPFRDASFELATMLHVGMNVRDKHALAREVARVLVPGGVFALYDVLRGPSRAPLSHPVPWADEPSTSFLATPDKMRGALEAAGFRVEHAQDRSAEAVAFFERLRAPGAPPPLGLHLVMGPSFPAKVANMAANLADGRIAPWELVCRRA